MSPANPTAKTYAALNQAFDVFNDRLFGGELPACLVTLQRKNKAYGYFAGGRFGSKDGAEITDEIALNPSHFKSRTDEQSLSTLAHEMAHLWQHHFGKPSRAGYHNKEWAAKMQEIGLHPSDTSQPGGKGNRAVMQPLHCRGRSLCPRLCRAGGAARLYRPLCRALGRCRRPEGAQGEIGQQDRYTCPSCELNAWAKPGVRLICGECDEPMAAAEEAGS
ncbi:SprT-like domain-containing protein [Brucella pituitosa]|uniref:SprT-like domain-containing protein n=1 Tax=Brucella pituitosa TaxID=571256 RepID=UPI000FE18C6E|nr:SprT-like domain-containing protein [Brucella pituitosa]